MTPTKPPVLTNEEITALTIRAIDDGWTFRQVVLATEQALLQRAGADAVRDAALEEAADAMQAYAKRWHGTEFYSEAANECIALVRALKVTPAAAVADAQPVAWPEADAENAAIGWTLDFKFVEQVREVAAMGYGFSAGQEEAEAILMAALSVHPLYAAPQAGQLSGNAGELDAVERQALVGLIEVASSAFHAADESEENDDPDWIYVDKQSMTALCNAVEALDQLPDDCPGYTMGPSGKAEWALRRFFGGKSIVGHADAIAASKGANHG